MAGWSNMAVRKVIRVRNDPVPGGIRDIPAVVKTSESCQIWRQCFKAFGVKLPDGNVLTRARVIQSGGCSAEDSDSDRITIDFPRKVMPVERLAADVLTGYTACYTACSAAPYSYLKFGPSWGHANFNLPRRFSTNFVRGAVESAQDMAPPPYGCLTAQEEGSRDSFGRDSIWRLFSLFEAMRGRSMERKMERGLCGGSFPLLVRQVCRSCAAQRTHETEGAGGEQGMFSPQKYSHALVRAICFAIGQDGCVWVGRNGGTQPGATPQCRGTPPRCRARLHTSPGRPHGAVQPISTVIQSTPYCSWEGSILRDST
ncbi:hypothetical protein FB451DRAFT_1174884 [Mycena latifolia]|nr:hypothetical protein FB451DRAFT_1174884 [Mycena latifolia]